jgi:hypothetical protein
MVKVGDGGEEIGGWRRREGGGLVLWDGRGEKVSFGEEDGEEFDQVKVALVPVVELDVPDEFGVSVHVVVSDHAAVPPATELHPDVSSDEVVRVRGRGMRRRGVGGGREYLRPFPPHGSEGISVVGNGGESLKWARIVLCRRRRAGRRGRSPRQSWSSDRLVRVRPGLGVGVRGGAWASRRGENGGDTRWSRRDCCRDERSG